MAIFPMKAKWVLVILAILCSADVDSKSPVSVPAPAPGPGTAATDCMTLIYNMSDCLTYVEQGSNLTKPDKPCCPELAGMLDTNPICLCNLLGKSSDFPVQLDLKKALKLPSACGLQTPSVSLCSAVGIPVAAGPGGAPAGSPASSEGPSGMSPDAGEGAGSSGKNGASNLNANYNIAYLGAGLVMALACLLSI